MPPTDTSWLGLAGRVAIVTGGASGIGRAVAAAFAGAGATVALLDRNGDGAKEAAAALTETGATAHGIACDTADEGSVKAAAAAAERAVGPADILVNNAGILRPGALDQVTLETWNQVMAVNLSGYLLAAQAFGQAMLARGRGAIVQIASIAASHPQTRSGAYSAAKAGVVMLTRQLAAEWGPKGVRANAISPGMIRTPLSEAFYATPGAEAQRAAITASRRVGRPEDIADVALFLASDRAGYVNGAELLVDGGFDCMLMEMVPRPGF